MRRVKIALLNDEFDSVQIIDPRLNVSCNRCYLNKKKKKIKIIMFNYNSNYNAMNDR